MKKINKAELLLKTDPALLKGKALLSIIKKISHFISEENQHPYDERLDIKKKLFDFCTNIFSNLRTNIKITEENKNVFQKFIAVVINDTNKINWKDKWIFIPLILEFEKVKEEPFIAANSFKVTFLNNSDKNSLDKLFKYINESEFNITPTPNDFILSNKKILYNKCIEDNNEYLYIIYSHLDDNNRSDLLDFLIQKKSYTKFNYLFEEYKYKIPNNYMVANSILDSMNDIKNINIFSTLFGYIDKMNIVETNKIDMDKYILNIRELINNNDSNPQRCIEKLNNGLHILNKSNYLVNNEKKDLLIDIINNWFKEVNSNKTKIITIISDETINYKIFDNVYKNNFSNFIDLTIDINEHDFIEKLFLKLNNLKNKRKFLIDLCDKIYNIISNPEPVPAMHYKSTIETIPKLLTKEIYDNNIKESLNKLLIELLKPEGNPVLHKISTHFLHFLKKYNKIDSSILNKTEELYIHNNITNQINNIELLKPLVDIYEKKKIVFEQIAPLTTNAKNHYRDDNFYDEIFDLLRFNVEVEITKVQSSINHWRIGFIFSKEYLFNISLDEKRHANKSFPVVHIGRTNNENKIKAVYYSMEGGHNNDKIILEKYKEQKIKIKASYNDSNTIINIICPDNEIKYMYSNLRFCKIFAWGDYNKFTSGEPNKFEIHTIINKYINK